MSACLGMENVLVATRETCFGLKFKSDMMDNSARRF